MASTYDMVPVIPVKREARRTGMALLQQYNLSSRSCHFSQDCVAVAELKSMLKKHMAKNLMSYNSHYGIKLLKIDQDYKELHMPQKMRVVNSSNYNKLLKQRGKVFKIMHSLLLSNTNNQLKLGKGEPKYSKDRKSVV